METSLEKATLRKTSLVACNLSRSNLFFANLHDADLTKANLFLTSLTKAYLVDANLTQASLYCTQLAKTDLEGAILTGTLIKDCNISSAYLKNVICEYIYLRQQKQERFPHDRNFNCGEFTKIFQQPKNISEILFQDGINWKAFAYAFNKSNIKIYDTTGEELYLREYKNYEGGLIILKVKIPEGIDQQEFRNNLDHEYQMKIASLKGEIKARDEMIAPLYEQLLSPSSPKYQTILKINNNQMFEQEKMLVLKAIANEFKITSSIKDSKLSKITNLDIHEIRVFLNQLEDSRLIKTIKHEQHQDPSQPKIDLVLVIEITSEGYLTLREKMPFNSNTFSNSPITINTGNVGISHMSGGEIKDNVKIAGIINETNQKELAQLLQDIQVLLEKLEQTYNPNTTTGKMTIATKAIEHIEQDSNLAKRVLSALEEGGIAWLQAKLINPSASFLVAALEDWQKNKQ